MFGNILTSRMVMHCLYRSGGSLPFRMWIKFGLLKILLNCAMLHSKGINVDKNEDVTCRCVQMTVFEYYLCIPVHILKTVLSWCDWDGFLLL